MTERSLSVTSNKEYIRWMKLIILSDLIYNECVLCYHIGQRFLSTNETTFSY